MPAKFMEVSPHRHMIFTKQGDNKLTANEKLRERVWFPSPSHISIFVKGAVVYV